MKLKPSTSGFEAGPGVRLSDSCYISRCMPVTTVDFDEPFYVIWGQAIARVLRWMGF